MNRFIWLLLLLPVGLVAQTVPDRAIPGWCQAGATKAQVSGMSSSNTLQGTIPDCTVTVYLTGTTTRATIHSDSNNTPLSNPFTAADSGQWTFWAQPATAYDIVLSGGRPGNTYSQPVTLTAIQVGGPGAGGATSPGGNNQEVQFNANGFFQGTTGLSWNSGTSTLNYPSGTFSAGTVTGTTITGTTITASGAINAASANVSGTITSTGAVSGATLNSTGDTTVGGTLNTSSVAATNGVTAATVNAGTVTSSGSVNGATLNTTGNATVGGNLTASGLNATNGVTAGSVTATGAVTAGSLTAGVINGPIAPTQVTWPPTCTGGTVYNPSNNSCVATGTANNPAGANGQLQFNSGGFFAATANASLDSSGNLTAANVNGVYDLKAAFGASASQQTMTCTATTGSNNLTCSGGTADFKVGSTVYIQAAGNNATISTPTAPTVTCAVYNSGSCAGSVVYGYEIGALQGSPNGAMTVIGPPTTITQSAQGAYQRANGGAAYTVTTVTWPTVSGVSKWVVYKNVNGGPYQFYTFVDNGQTLNDNGHPNMGGGSLFTCVDLAVPCTAPTGATPDDVFAKITAISGATVTLGPLTYPPKRQLGGVEATFPSTPGVSGTFTVQHDDTPAFAAAYIALQSNNPDNTPSTLHLPVGTFLTHNADPWGFGSMIRGTNLNNVTIVGEGPASRIIQSNDRAGIHGNFSLFQCGGSNSTLPSSGCLSWTGNQPTHGVVPAGSYPLSDPVNKGSVQVTMASPADAAHFTAGEYVSIFINAADPTYPANMYGELNRIKKVDTTAGVLTLEYPTTKMYSATLNPPYSACVNCALPAYIGPISPQATVHNLTLKNFYYSGYNMFLNYSGVDGITMENLTLRVHMLETEGFSRHQIIRNNTIYDADLGRLIVENADASADAVVEGNQYIDAAFASTGQTCSEGSANVQIRNNVHNLSGNTYNDNLSGIMGGDLCYDFDVANNTVNINNASFTSLFGVNPYTSGQLRDNIFTTDATSRQAAPVVSSSTWPLYFTIRNNRWKSGGGEPLAYALNNTDVENLSNYTLSPQSGDIQIYTWYGSTTMFRIPMAGNITSINLGSARVPGYYYILNFVQAASGGPYALPSDCTGTKWITGGNPVDCPNGAPKANPAASSSTMVTTYDDGTTVHVLASSYQPIAALADVTSTAASTNYVLTCTAVSGGKCSAWSPQPGVTAGGAVVAVLDLTGLTANLGNTIVYTVPTGKTGWYRVSCYEVVTTAGVGSSTLPQCGLIGSDAETGVTIQGKTFSGGMYIGTTNTRNLVSAINTDGGNQYGLFHAPAGSNIQVNTGTSGAYAPGTGAPMQYSIHVQVELVTTP